MWGAVLQQGQRCLARAGALRAAAIEECSTSVSGVGWLRPAGAAAGGRQQQRGAAADAAEQQQPPQQRQQQQRAAGPGPPAKQKQKQQKKEGGKKPTAVAPPAATAGPAAPAAAAAAAEHARWHSGLDVGRALDAAPGTYFDAPLAACPEATKQFYADPALEGERVNQPNYGCRGVQAEYEYSRHEALMQRPCLAALLAALRAAAGRGEPLHEGAAAAAAAARRLGRLYLDGWAGAGKSVALFMAVAWARANGWVALYVPSAAALTHGGTFVRGEDGLWDTPWAARYILSAVQVPVLLAVDDYNALFAPTGYHESMHSFYRRPIAPDELRLARAFRLLEQPRPARGATLAAPTLGQSLSDKIHIPRPKGSRFPVPRYDLSEVAATAEYLRATRSVGGGDPLSEDALRKALFLTNGNAKELRQYAQLLLNEADPLGISLGHKAAEAATRGYEQSAESFAVAV
eukprot:scaffold4.g4908.t1